MKKALLALALLVLAGGGYLLWATGRLDAWLATPVERLRNEAARYPEGARVTVHGRVGARVDVPFSSKDLYELSDGTGAIWVRCEGGLPPEGARVTVRGTLRRVEGDLPFVQVRGMLLQQEGVRVR